MCGLPFAGKTHVATELVNKMKYESFHINPKDYRDGFYQKMSEDDKRSNNIACWSVCCDVLDEQLNKSDNEIFIFDTTCSNKDKMTDIIQSAKKRKHHVVLIYVSSTLDVIYARMIGDDLLSDKIMSDYNDKLGEAIPIYRSIVNKMFILNNNGVTPDVSRILKYIEGHYGD